MHGVMLVKAGLEFPSGREFKETVDVLAKDIEEIKVKSILETLGRVDFVVVFEATDIETATEFATLIRRQKGITDSESLIGIDFH